MTQEDKELLLKDLCARLPYGIKFKADDEKYIREIHYIKDENVYIREYRNLPYWIDTIKPYLRPMSSMTEEECDMVEEILGDKCIFDFMSNGDIILKQGQFSQKKLAKLYDYYNSIHIDYRGLIPMGLALEASENMYNIKNV